MSLLIMGLGITSVFTLFPMSILRSIKSTNLTHAALLADTARDYYLYRKETLTKPPSHFVPIGSQGYYNHQQDLFLYDGAIADSLIPEPFVGTFVVDPLGGVNATDYGNNPGYFGRPVGGTVTPPGGVLRVANQLGLDATSGGGMSTVDYTIYSSLDSWVTVYDDVPLSVVDATDPVSPTGAPHNYDAVTQINLPSTAVLTSDLIAPPEPWIPLTTRTYPASRILATSFDRRVSITRNINTHPTPGPPNQVWVWPRIPATSFGGNLNNIGRVQVQNFERRYSYLMTMHRDELGSTRAQLVVFFRREFGESETSYPVDPNIGNNRTFIDKRTRKLTVDVGGGSTRSPRPGDYVFGTWRAKPTGPGFNVIRGRWYRIVSVATESSTKYRLTLDRAWEGLTDEGNDPRLMLPSGVISVFDL
ncbi:MAG: hypothetical protein ACK5Q5_06125 [Planctomycetaceae bacterium]